MKYSGGGETLTVVNPDQIIDTNEKLMIQQADEIKWEYAYYGISNNNNTKSIIYKRNRNNTIIKTISGKEKMITPQKDIAVQCIGTYY